MVLIILAIILVAAIAFFQVIQGIFSALIMTILSVLCALVAFNYYESLAQVIRGWGLASTYVYAVSLMGIFFVSLLALRILFDRLFLENMTFGIWTDRIGGGALGIITGMVLVGMMTLAMQMLPWDASILGYKPYDDSLQQARSLAPFKSDQFVLGMVDFLSGPAGSMGGDKQFTQVHPDYLLELQANRNRCELPGRCDSSSTAMQVVGIYSVPMDDKGNLPPWLLPPPQPGTNNENVEPEKDLTTYIVRVSVNPQALDPDGWYRLPGTHFRLVTESNGACRFYYPVAFLTYQPKRPKGEPYAWKPIFGESTPESKGPNFGGLLVERNTPGNLTVDWVYKVPAGETPQRIVFRNVCKVPVHVDAENQLKPPDYAPYNETEDKFQKDALKRNQAH